MNGIVILTDNYTYEGKIINKWPHGYGKFQYTNNDTYTGMCKYGKPDGFGTYVFNQNKSVYTGYFSIGKIHGIGTFEDSINIYKGTWRNDKKHGSFYKTNKITFKTYKQIWLKNKLVSSIACQFIQPCSLATTKNNPVKTPKVFQIKFKGVEKLCMACMEKPTNATNIACGHVVMCDECLNKCDKCPICRAPITHVLKLYVS